MTFPRLPASENELIDALAVCLDAMAIGSDLETCLGMYPTLAEDLRPLLQTAQTAQIASPLPVPIEAMNRSRTRLLGRAAEYRTAPRPRAGVFAWLTRTPRFAVSSLVTIMVLFAGLFTINSLAARALPGDAFYPLKLSIENATMGLTPGSPAQQALEQVYRERRIDEVRALLIAGREETITFEGVFAARELLSGVAPERLLVSDIYVLNTIDTTTIGELEIGMLIQVVGRTRADGYVEATVLRPRAFAFVGLVESITSDAWRVDGRAVGIRAETQIDAGVELGSKVMVLAEFDDEATLFARAILLTAPAEDTPTEPQPTPTVPNPSETTSTPTSPTPTPTASPTSTPTSTVPLPSSTPLPPATEEASPSATPSASPQPSDDPTATSEPEPTASPAPTLEPTDDDNDNDNDNDNENENENENDNEDENDNENEDDNENDG